MHCFFTIDGLFHLTEFKHSWSLSMKIALILAHISRQIKYVYPELASWLVDCSALLANSQSFLLQCPNSPTTVTHIIWLGFITRHTPTCQRHWQKDSTKTASPLGKTLGKTPPLVNDPLPQLCPSHHTRVRFKYRIRRRAFKHSSFLTMLLMCQRMCWGGSGADITEHVRLMLLPLFRYSSRGPEITARDSEKWENDGHMRFHNIVNVYCSGTLVLALKCSLYLVFIQKVICAKCHKRRSSHCNRNWSQ